MADDPSSGDEISAAEQDHSAAAQEWNAAAYQSALSGGSAERKARELTASADPAAAAWLAGLAGERRVAGELAKLPTGWTVLHDRLIRPGRSEANLDHVVVGPGGVFLVDAKNRGGRVTEWDGGLFQHVMRNGHSQSLSLAGELQKVHGMAAYMAAEANVAVTPVLCLAGMQEAGFGEPRMLRGVWVVPVSRLVDWLGHQPRRLSEDGFQRVVTTVMTEFPSTTTDPALLAAMGQAAAQAQTNRGSAQVRAPRPRRHPRAVPQPRVGTPRRVKSPSGVGRRLLIALAVGLGMVLLGGSVISGIGSALSRLSTLPVVRMPKPLVGGPSVSASVVPPSCTSVTAKEIATIIGRPVQPVATTAGCSWGSRLDDPATVLVQIRMGVDEPADDPPLKTSIRDHRVVYGKATDPTYHPATGLWVAAGQPIGKGATATTALVNTKVVVSTTMLKTTDDKARAMALAIAAAVNRAP